ncbi:uncharacterized protein [Centroberyx affinis]|uniref:uncharacterized protein n=1 Tax=Centroberyx affinis TaxID=166261 RepID=UPI003A5C74F2
MASKDQTDREWRDEIDQKLIEFWKEHECLFNASKASYQNKKLKTQLWSEFALSMGLNVSDVERRSRSLRTQYGRLIGHPEKITTKKKRMLKEQLSFLKPYIVPRRVTDAQDEDEEDDEDEEEETEGSVDTGSMFGSPLRADAFGPDPRFSASPLHRPPSQPQLTEAVSLSCNCPYDDSPPEPVGDGPKNDVLSQFVKVMLSDMHQIKDSMVLMRLRRDITDLVFKAVEQDVQRRRV